jgi:hypothetical protein
MTTERIYRGRITGMRQVNIDTLGYRYFTVSFSGKQMLYIKHKKSSLDISIGDFIRFTGEFRGEPGKEYFQILEVISQEKIEMLESQNLAEALAEI